MFFENIHQRGCTVEMRRRRGVGWGGVSHGQLCPILGQPRLYLWGQKAGTVTGCCLGVLCITDGRGSGITHTRARVPEDAQAGTRSSSREGQMLQLIGTYFLHMEKTENSKEWQPTSDFKSLMQDYGELTNHISTRRATAPKRYLYRQWLTLKMKEAKIAVEN